MAETAQRCLMCIVMRTACVPQCNPCVMAFSEASTVGDSMGDQRNQQPSMFVQLSGNLQRFLIQIVSRHIAGNTLARACIMGLAQLLIDPGL